MKENITTVRGEGPTKLSMLVKSSLGIDGQ